jgi:hypothetical protein
MRCPGAASRWGSPSAPGSTTTRRRKSTTEAAGRASRSSSQRYGTVTASACAKTCGSSSAAWPAPRSRAWPATPTATHTTAASALAAWSDLGRPGRPLLWGQGYFALGDEAQGASYLRDYYAFTGPFAVKIAAGNLTSPRAIRDFVRGYEEAGCDELILFPTVADVGQLERLAEVLA